MAHSWSGVGGVGIDWALFPELVESDVVLTNSRGVFDTSLPEYLLSLMLALVKDMPATYRAQQRHEWQHRLLEPLSGGRAVIVGAGSIARASGRLLRAIEKATGNSIEKMELPSVGEVTDKRIEAFKRRITETLDTRDLELFRRRRGNRIAHGWVHPRLGRIFLRVPRRDGAAQARATGR